MNSYINWISPAVHQHNSELEDTIKLLIQPEVRCPLESDKSEEEQKVQKLNCIKRNI